MLRLSDEIKVSKERLQPIVALEQMLRHDAGLGDDRHKIVVAFPARHDVPMEMILDPRAGALAEIHAEIDPARLERLLARFPERGAELR